jgi:hypothetical protein
MNRYNERTTGKYELISTLLGKSHQAVKKYFYYNRKDVNNAEHVKDYFKKEYNKNLIKSFKDVLA